MFVAIANTSAAIVAYQMPFKSNNNGIINTQDVWYSNVLHVAETTEINPLFNAVKNDDVNTFNPYAKKEKA